MAVLQDGFAQALLEQGDGRQLPPELAQLARGQVPALPRRWDLPEAVRQICVLAFTNVLDPYEIDAGEARFEAIPDLFVDLGWSSTIGRKVRDAIVEVSGFIAVEKRGLSNKTKVVAAAAGIALLAAGPIGIALAGSAGAVGAAAITSGLAAFGPGGMVGGLATLGSLASTGAMVTTVAATARGGAQPLLVDPTSVAIHVAIAHSLNTIGEPYDTELWYRLTAAETELDAELNRLVPFSDEKAPAAQRLRAASKTIADLMDFMRQKKLTPPAIDRALANS